MNPYGFTALVFVLGIAMGIGKAAVYKHIPHYFPDQVGSVGGLVGVIGGLGGFVMPILFGALAQATRLPTTTFAFLFVLSTVFLVWMHVVVRRLMRKAAPALAGELERGGGRPGGASGARQWRWLAPLDSGPGSATARHFTWAGVGTQAVPSPTWPSRFDPQARSVPSVITPTVW
jgi:MFS family permease